MFEVKELERRYREGRITRREFLTRASAMGLAVAISPTLLSGTVKAATPKKGGRLRIGISGGSTTDSMDPGTTTDMMGQVTGRMCMNHLVEINHKNEPIPELAESWEASPGAKQWVFKLRKGVEFHNSKTMDSEDVVFSINHHRGEKSKSAAKGIVDPIVDVKADGKHAVVFTLREGNADFPYIISDYHLLIMPAGTKDFNKGIGTGPYILKNFEPGVRVFSTKNPNYWKEGRGHFDEVELLGISDINARTNALKTGQVDVMNRCPRKTVHLMEKMRGIKVIRTDGNKHYTMAMLTNIKPYDNNDVRLALKYAIDREQFLKIILRGYGYVGNDHPIGRNQRYFAANLPQRHYDPDKAKFHLKKAGLENHTFKFHTADGVFDGAVDGAVLYKENAAKAGINIEIVKEPSDGYWSNVWIKKPWCMVFWGGRPTEDWMFSTAYAEDASWNDTKWKHDRFNKLLKAGRAELNETKRRDMYVEMQSIVRDEGGVVVPVFASDMAGASDKVKFENVASDLELDGFRAPERWWFA